MTCDDILTEVKRLYDQLECTPDKHAQTDALIKRIRALSDQLKEGK